VEFTVALPLLLFLILAVAEFGRAFLQYNQLTRAVQDGVRLVASEAVGNSTGVINLDAALVATAKNLVVFGNTAGTGTALLPGLTAANVTVSNLGGGNIAVSVTYSYQPIIGTRIPDLVQGGPVATLFTLRAEGRMRAIS
jgi:Flp pilus assembly protein TadG